MFVCRQIWHGSVVYPFALESGSLSCLSTSGYGDKGRGKVKEELHNNEDICNHVMSLSAFWRSNRRTVTLTCLLPINTKCHSFLLQYSFTGVWPGAILVPVAGIWISRENVALKKYWLRGTGENELKWHSYTNTTEQPRGTFHSPLLFA